MEKMRSLLESAHNPPEGRTGSRSSPDEEADLDAAFESLFFQLPIEQQANYLSAVSIKEVIAKLGLMPPDNRGSILELLPSYQREPILNRLGISA